MAGQKAKAAQAQEHHQDLKACCDDDDCCDALTQAKATVEAAGLDYMAILKAMLIALAQALAGGLVKTSAAKKGGA